MSTGNYLLITFISVNMEMQVYGIKIGHFCVPRKIQKAVFSLSVNGDIQVRVGTTTNYYIYSRVRHCGTLNSAGELCFSALLHSLVALQRPPSRSNICEKRMIFSFFLTLASGTTFFAKTKAGLKHD